MADEDGRGERKNIIDLKCLKQPTPTRPTSNELGLSPSSFNP